MSPAAEGRNLLAGDLELAVPLHSLTTGYIVTSVGYNEIPARPPCFLTGVSPSHIWCYIVYSCLTCGLVFTYTKQFVMCQQINGYDGDCSLKLSCCFVLPCFLSCGLGVESPLFSVAASVLHDYRFPPNILGGVSIPYHCSMCKLVHHHSQIGRTQFKFVDAFLRIRSVHEVHLQSSCK